MEAKPKQETSDPGQTSREENPSVTPTGSVESGTPTSNLLPEDYKVEPVDPPTARLMNPQRTMRKPPDFPELARSGDLPASIKPYELGRRKKDGSLYLKYCGAGGDGSTATTTNSVRLGYEKAIDTARAFRAQYPDADASEIRDEVGHLEGVDEEYIDKEILHSARSSKELGAELVDMALANISEVKRWGVAPPTPAGGIQPAPPNGMPKRSEWRRSIYQAVVACEPTAGYKEIAAWISENLVLSDLPKYCAGKGERELSHLVRKYPDVRKQFQKDVSKMKNQYLKTQK